MRSAIVWFAMMVATAPACGWAWGFEGHKISSLITESLLTPGAKAKISELLEGQSIAEASTWADEIRNLPPYAFSRPLHYVNIERGAEGYDEERDCPKGECVVGAIEKYSAELRDTEVSERKRREALKFLIHFVQDIHQPLHASRTGDRGGNDIQVTFFGGSMNLHALWDTGLIQKLELGADEIAKTLLEQIDGEDVEEWKSLNPADWANESYRISLENAYPIGDGELGEDYFQKNKSVVLMRLAQGGVRLALLLNSIFDAGGEQSSDEQVGAESAR